MRSAGRILTLILIFGILGAVGTYIHHRSSSSSSSLTFEQVAYYVTGTATTANLTMQTSSGSTQQNDVRIPVSSGGVDGLHFVMAGGSFLYISAQNQDSAGDVTCRIEVNGIEVATNTASGGYAIATCDGRV